MFMMRTRGKLCLRKGLIRRSETWLENWVARHTYRRVALLRDEEHGGEPRLHFAVGEVPHLADADVLCVFILLVAEVIGQSAVFVVGLALSLNTILQRRRAK